LPDTPPPRQHLTLSQRFGSDFGYLANNLAADAEDTVKSPLRIGRLLRDRRSFWALALTGAALGASIGFIDEPARDAFGEPEDKSANGMRHDAELALWGSTALLYAYGLGADDSRAREVALTTLESTVITGFLVKGSKLLFGRARPKENQGARAWGGSGHSFVSNSVTPAFVLAAGLSEYWDNRWYVALPAYGAASFVGYTRMRADAHWFSDVLASALIGVGTTKLLLHMHGENARNPSRFRVFPMVTSSGGVGLQAAYAWGGAEPAPPPASARADAAVPAGFRAWKAYQLGAFVPPVLDARDRLDPRMPEIDLGDLALRAY
jgi:membrane-associated phospholipid phosphatase